jgi:tetratricopeptide (TPR) repeat protein
MVLRLIDQVADQDAPADLIEHRAHTTLAFLRQLTPKNAEAVHLEHIADAVLWLLPDRTSLQILWSQLRLYADYLRGALQLDEAIDVLETADRGVGLHDPTLRSTILLALGSTLRLARRVEEAERTYRMAREAAAQASNKHDELLARIGLANVARNVGNLPKAVAELEAVIADAGAASDLDAFARAQHDLGATHYYRGEMLRAAQEMFEAFRAYRKPDLKYRALADLGVVMTEAGHYRGAQVAYEIVICAAPLLESRVSATIEVMDLASRSGDRLAFARWRNTLEQYGDLPPEERVDSLIKLGQGYARFGDLGQARQYLMQAAECAQSHGLHQFAFQSEDEISKLALEGSDPPAAMDASPPAELETVYCALNEIRTSEVDLLSGT